MKDNFKVLFVNYNVQTLIHIAIKSLRKFHPHCIIYVFDNSDNGTKFENKYENVTVFDNTEGQYVSLKNVPKGDERHTISIQKCMELINDNFLHLDTDTVVLKPLDNLIDDRYAACGKIHYYNTELPADNPKSQRKHRFLVCCMYINVKMCKENGVKFYNADKINGLWLTSASFYQELKIKGLPIKETTLGIHHLSAGSRYYLKNKVEEYNKWIEKYKYL